MVRLRKAFFTFFDEGSDAVSVIYKGNGIGSKVSLVITVIAALALLVFLGSFGLFGGNTSKQQFSREIE